MRKLTLLALAVAAIGAVASWDKIDSRWIGPIRHFIGGAGPLSPQPAADEPSNPPPARLSDRTRALSGKVKLGMTPAQVAGILGKPAIGQVRVPGDGKGVNSAGWLVGADMISVEFRHGVVALVTATPLAQLPQAKPPGQKPPAKSAGPRQPAAAPLAKGALDELISQFKSLAHDAR